MNNPKMWGINWIVSIVMLFLNIRNKLTITYNNPNAMKAFSVFRQIEYFKPYEHYLKSISSRFPFYLKFKLYQLPKLSLLSKEVLKTQFIDIIKKFQFYSN